MASKVAGGRAIKKSLPFSIVANSAKSLVNQVTDGLRASIASGRYQCGDVIPSYRDLAEALGVSVIVTKAALKNIAAEGLVISRPRIGSVVCASNERHWKGRVLLVKRSDGCGYYDNVFASALRRHFADDGWLCIPATVQGRAETVDADVSELKVLLAHSVSMAIVLFDNQPAEKTLSDAGVPFVVLGDKTSYRNRCCRGYLRYDRSAEGERFASVCRAEGIGRVVQVGVRDFDDVKKALRKAGIACKPWILDEPPPDRPSGAYAELARDAFVDYLKSGTPLPDAFYFTDDYLCAGALAALSDMGIRAPQDVRIATWANKGNVPIYARPLSRIEIDPWKNAAETYAFCRAVLSGERGAKPPVLAPTWVEGATMTHLSDFKKVISR